jgi:hypothetical protein
MCIQWRKIRSPHQLSQFQGNPLLGWIYRNLKIDRRGSIDSSNYFWIKIKTNFANTIRAPHRLLGLEKHEHLLF